MVFHPIVMPHISICECVFGYVNAINIAVTSTSCSQTLLESCTYHRVYEYVRARSVHQKTYGILFQNIEERPVSKFLDRLK